MKPQFFSDIAFGASAAPQPTHALIYYFDLDPVFRHLGSTGLMNPERMQDICERHVRSIAGSDLVLFTGQGFYLVVTSGGEETAAGLARFVNMSLLMLLFGTEKLSPEQDIPLFRRVRSEDLPAAANFQMQDLARWNFVDDTPALEAAFADAADSGPVNTLIELARDGVHVEQGVELIFFPVHDLQRRTVSSLFCAPSFAGAVFGHQAFQNMNPAELPYIDRAILMHALSFADRLAEAGVDVDVGAAVSFQTLAFSKSREIYQAALRSIGIDQHPRLYLKIEDIPEGTTTDRIARAVSALRPFTKHISVHLPNNAVEMPMVGRMGASGLVLSLQRRARLPEILADCKGLCRSAASQNATSCIDHVESDEALAVVRSSGIRYAVGNVFGAETVRGTNSIADVVGVLERIDEATSVHLGAIA